MLEIYAGKSALNTIKEQGFQADLFNNFLGASGGPKWFTLFGLDKYLFGEFFKDRTTPLNIVGSSAGAFRAACFAQKDPVAAISRLAKNYSETVYSAKAKPEEITQKARELLDEVFGDNGADEIINNSVFQAHFIVAKAKGLVSYENKLMQALGLFISFSLNRLDRSLLKHQYQRYIYQTQTSDFDLEDPYQFETTRIGFSKENIKQALLASGAIPMVMEGIGNIANSPPGMYRDGGIIDYHFDFLIKNEGLTLYPHFSAKPKAGWFDKNLARKVSLESYDKTVLLCPSEKFVQSLPYGKIPDRTDFTKMDADTRLKYWREVLKRTEDLADEFKQFVERQDIAKIRPFTG